MSENLFNKTVKFIDLFCGIGGFRLAFENACQKTGQRAKCVFSSDIDKHCQEVYKINFNETPVGDITKFSAKDIPDHDILLAGFPCQAFSIIGNGKGFSDKARGTLFFDIARILLEKKPKAFVLENVKQLHSHNSGETLKTINETLRNFGYDVSCNVLNALKFGLPQKRERIFIVGVLSNQAYEWPKGNAIMKPLELILENDKDVSKEFWASPYIQKKRKSAHKSKYSPSIWHENKAGNISSYPYSCALRANASYNYLLVNGQRRLTPREMFRLQGFPDSFKILDNVQQCRTQAGNSLPVPVAEAVIHRLLSQFSQGKRKQFREELSLL